MAIALFGPALSRARRRGTSRRRREEGDGRGPARRLARGGVGAAGGCSQARGRSSLPPPPATVRGIRAELELPVGVTLAAGKLRDDIGQLEGKAYKHTGVSFWPDYNVTDDRVKHEWIVRGEAGATVGVTARHERAGTVRASIA